MPDPMPDPMYYEYVMSQMPNVARICQRCKGGLVYKPLNGEPFCLRKGCHNEGELFVRFEAIATFLRGHGLDIQKLYSEGKLVYTGTEIKREEFPKTPVIRRGEDPSQWIG